MEGHDEEDLRKAAGLALIRGRPFLELYRRRTFPFRDTRAAYRNDDRPAACPGRRLHGEAKGDRLCAVVEKEGGKDSQKKETAGCRIRLSDGSGKKWTNGDFEGCRLVLFSTLGDNTSG